MSACWTATPEDWGCFYRTCPDCGARYHASEGGCDCAELAAEAADLDGCDECGGDCDCATCGEPSEEEIAQLARLVSSSRPLLQLWRDGDLEPAADLDDEAAALAALEVM